MGLDQYAYRIKTPAKWDDDGQRLDAEDGSKREQFFGWRKHPDLQGWMEQRWRVAWELGPFHADVLMDHPAGNFNCVDLELTAEDLDALEQDLLNGKLPTTTGFFFGTGHATDRTRREDLEFIRLARKALDEGYRVVYTSWW